MIARTLAVSLLAAIALPAWADAAADEAEARRRGIPVAQLQAERNLDAEKAKTAALEATLAAINKQIADLEKKNAAPAPGPAATTAAPKTSETLYRDIVRRYMAGDWEKLLDDVASRQKDFASLPEENQANLTYIKGVVTESRQSWWDAAKSGKAGAQKATVWKHDVSFTFSNAATPRFTPPAGTVLANMSWPKDMMDSFDAMSLVDAGLALQGNFRKGDGLNQLAWGYVSFADLFATVGVDKIRTMNAADKEKFNVFGGFDNAVTAGYYGTPSARRLVMVQCLASFEKMNDSRPDWKGKRPIGAAIMVEMKVHKYPSVAAGGGITIIGLERAEDPHEAEMLAAKPIILGISNTKFTLEEDKQLREMFKLLGEANRDWTSPQITLPNNLSYNFNTEADIPLAKERLKGGK